MEPEYFALPCNQNDIRLDTFLAENLVPASGQASRTRAQALIKSGAVTVSGTQRKPSYRLTAGELVEGEIPPPESLSVPPMPIALDIIYEDASLLVVNKPKDMPVHPAPGHFDDTLVNALLYYLGDNLSEINGVLRPGIVHRIDKDTTGLLVVAKTNEAHQHLAEQFKRHTIERTYAAIIHGLPHESSGDISAPIGRNEKNRLKMAVTTKNSKEAITHYRVEQRFQKHALIRAQLETGRTHQIRVHMAHIGHPVLGDPLYSTLPCPFKTNGQALHAQTLGFVHPQTGRPVHFTSSLPEYLQKILDSGRL